MFVRFRCARARATQKARHAFRPAKMHTKLLSGVPRATRKSQKIIRKSMRKRMRARTSQKQPPNAVRRVFGASRGVLEASGSARRPPESVPGPSRERRGAGPERPGSVPEVPQIALRSPRGPPDGFHVDLDSISARFGSISPGFCFRFASFGARLSLLSLRLFVPSFVRLSVRLFVLFLRWFVPSFVRLSVRLFVHSFVPSFARLFLRALLRSSSVCSL